MFGGIWPVHLDPLVNTGTLTALQEALLGSLTVIPLF